MEEGGRTPRGSALAPRPGRTHPCSAATSQILPSARDTGAKRSCTRTLPSMDVVSKLRSVGPRHPSTRPAAAQNQGTVVQLILHRVHHRIGDAVAERAAQLGRRSRAARVTAYHGRVTPTKRGGRGGWADLGGRRTVEVVLRAKSLAKWWPTVWWSLARAQGPASGCRSRNATPCSCAHPSRGACRRRMSASMRCAEAVGPGTAECSPSGVYHQPRCPLLRGGPRTRHVPQWGRQGRCGVGQQSYSAALASALGRFSAFAPSRSLTVGAEPLTAA